MQVLCKPGDKFRIGNNVTLEILKVNETTAEVEVTTPEGSYVEIIEAPDAQQAACNAAPYNAAPYNRISGYLSMN